jgi:hypothetical protein
MFGITLSLDRIYFECSLLRGRVSSKPGDCCVYCSYGR